MVSVHSRATTRRAFRRAPNLFALAIAMTFASAAPVLSATDAHAQSPHAGDDVRRDDVRRYDIPAGNLDDALIAFGRHSGLMIGTDPALTHGVQSAGLHGSYAPSEGLDTLLRGSGVAATLVEGGAYKLYRLPTPPASTDPTMLKPVHVKGHVETAWTETDGYVALRSAAGTKTDTPLLETPQSISVVTAGQIADQAAQSVGATLRYSPGVRGDTFGVTTDRDYVRVRGFMPNFYLDGLMLPYGLGGQGTQSEPFGLERVEVVRGPSSVLFGQNPPGGIISMTSKRPTEDARHEVQLDGGSHDRVQGAFDFSGPVDPDGKLLYRFVALRRDSGTQVDGADDNRTYLAPSLTFHPSADTSFTLLAQYQKDDAGIATQYYPAYGTLYANPLGQIHSNLNLGDAGRDALNREYYAVGYEADHAFNDDWKVKQAVRYAHVKTHNYSTWGNGFVTDPATGLPSDYRTLLRRTTDINRSMDEFTVDNQVQGKFRTFGLEHTILAGFDFRRETIDNYTGTVATSSIDIFNPVNTGVTPAITYTANNLQTLNQYGVYLQDQVKLDRWILTLSGRNDWSRASLNNRRTNLTSYANDNAFTGRAALGYLFDSGVAPYVSYSTSFEPQIGTTSPESGSRPYTPTRGQQTEIGIKYQPKSFDALFAVSLFDMKQKDVLTPDPENILYAVQTGEVGSRGVELEARAALTRQIKLIASYSFTDTRVLASNTASQPGKQLPLIPKHQASLWATYSFDRAALSGLEVGAGVRYTSGSYGDTANLWKTASYAVFDLMARYDLGHIDGRLKGASLAINVQNVGDREYLTGCQSAGSCEFGERRAIIGTVRYLW
ncbi:TonB-dependent siderophore receptor [Paraburkholderia sp. BCC1886]|uniref:TonB-dependent siderophore receptor n=1 Tax=Paraburkholderia sp. BCC1886 TaxID=2562670 RepID=UPI001182D5D3|nr:TonB-dependent siderophore receptor [Paraburkholderia sp. BCC1886]